MSATSIPPPLSQGWGYGVVVGFGAAFAGGMMIITEILRRSTGENNKHFETFAVAGRRIGVGLTATAVISSWAWSTALLSSSAITYNYGVAGAYWFGAGCLVQICFFSLIAIQSKRRAPHAHTVLEVVRARYGTGAHLLYMFLCLATNLIATVNMALGASATISALTGMSVYAAIFLLPAGVCVYTMTGGLRASFITDYMHTFSLLLILVYLILKILSSDAVGTIDRLYDLVQNASRVKPVDGNYQGSYLTMSSQGAIAFGTLHTLGNFGLVLLDSGYWQRGWSADVTAAAPGYILGGVLYFGIPWALGTIAGCVGLGLDFSESPYWPLKGRHLSTAENNNGLVLPYAGLAATGSAGAVAVVIVIFMACTSTLSSQIVAVSSILSSDVYHQYINKAASERSIIIVTRISCVLFALVGAAVSAIFYHIGLSLTWTLYFLGVITTPGMATISMTVLWNRQTKKAAIISPIVGLICGLATWIATSWHYGNRVLDVTTTGALIPCMWGNIVSAFVPIILSPTISLLFPEEPFQWERFNAIKLVSDSASTESALERETDAFTDAELRYMRRTSTIVAALGVTFFLAVWVVWPFGMYGAYYIFSRPFFRGWVIVSIIWLFAALLIVTFLPLIEGHKSIWAAIIGSRRSSRATDIPGVAPHDQVESEKDEHNSQENHIGTPHSSKSVSQSGSP